ncbi:MAG: hypothetical protein IJU14_02685 [Clostridia bacterium]|nr:hypothetical protein [Clostridia bacterium]
MNYSFMDTITERVAEVLEPKGYQKQNVETDKDYAALFTGESNAYMVVYNAKKQLTALKVCGMDDGQPDNQWKSISTWIFNPETDGNKEINSIANDFTDFLAGGMPKITNKGKKKNKNSDDGNADPKFFCKRMVNVFPQLKEEIWAEEDGYDPFRGVTFTEEHIVPKVSQLMQTGNKQDIQKLANILNTQYSAGDLSTRSIITIVVLNSIKPEDEEKIEEYLSEDLAKAWKFARPYRTKKVKPEKVKPIKPSMMERLGEQ